MLFKVIWWRGLIFHKCSLFYVLGNEETREKKSDADLPFDCARYLKMNMNASLYYYH